MILELEQTVRPLLCEWRILHITDYPQFYPSSQSTRVLHPFPIFLMGHQLQDAFLLLFVKLLVMTNAVERS